MRAVADFIELINGTDFRIHRKVVMRNISMYQESGRYILCSWRELTYLKPVFACGCFVNIDGMDSVTQTSYNSFFPATAGMGLTPQAERFM